MRNVARKRPGNPTSSRACCAHEQAYAQLVFQFANARADGGLREMLAARRLQKTAVRGDGQKRAGLVDVHAG
jgi:hypothetical protein